MVWTFVKWILLDFLFHEPLVYNLEKWSQILQKSCCDIAKYVCFKVCLTIFQQYAGFEIRKKILYREYFGERSEP